MERFAEISIDLTAQELADPAAPAASIEVDDIGEFDALLDPLAATAKRQPPEPGPDDDTVEIELTTEQMESMLKSLPKR